MTWCATVLDWNGKTGTVFIQNEDGQMFVQRKMSLITKDTIASAISAFSNTPVNRVKYVDDKYKRNGMTVFRFQVFPF